MIEIEVTQDMIERAEEKAAELGKLKKSITAGRGNTAGFLGEEVVASLLEGSEIVNTKDFDLLYKGLKYDIKTKRCTSKPLPHYDCSVAAANVVQRCDRYIFVRIEYDKESEQWGRAWVLGWFDKKLYFEFARKLKKGQRDGDNWFTVKADCYNFPIEALEGMDKL